jgi:hypothetical protein
MIVGLLALCLSTADTTLVNRPPIDTTPMPVTGTLAVSGVAAPPLSSIAALPTLVPSLLRAPTDTGSRKRARAVQYSEWYGRRVAIHKALSWTMLPLFAVSYYTGTQLADNGRAGVSSTVRTLHPIAAGGAAAVFGVNTVTGVWNLWESRRDPADRKRRYLHSALFLLADAGFAYAGSLGEDAGEDGRIRSRHRNIAIGSMGVSTAGWLIMLLRD